MGIRTNSENKLHILQYSFGYLQFVVRESSVDKQVMTDMYQRLRFFPSDYRPSGSDTILDIGAHIGVFSVIAARQNPQGKIYAIEPSIENFELLEKNINLNNLSNIYAYRTALASWNGQATLHLHDENWAHSIIRESKKVVEQSERVQAETLDYFLQRHAINKVDYVKMNVEGAEYQIILGSTPDALHRIGCMLVEFHPSADYDERSLIERLEGCGFQIKIVWCDDEKGKGWLTARVKY